MAAHGSLWKVKSKGAILVLLQNVLVHSSFVMAVVMVFFADTVSKATVGTILSATLPATCCPLVGWLADVRFGRYKVLRFGLWLLWTGMLCISVAFILPTMLNHDVHDQLHISLFVLRYGGLVLAIFGFVALAVNAVQFGIDQMPDASSDELSAYIHWFVWAMFAGGFIVKVTYIVWTTNKFLIKINVAVVLIPMTIISLALCCEFLFRGWLIIEPGCPNSLRMIYRVLKFAATHKYPIRRRAITYTEDEKPSRIDFAKDKYGGPFTTEQVEDVKTFFRLTVVLASLIIVAVPAVLLITSMYVYVLEDSEFYHGKVYQLTYSLALFVASLIPFYTVIIHPLLKRRVFSMMQRLLASAALVFLWSGTLLVLKGLTPHFCLFSNLCGSVNYPFQVFYNFIMAVVVVLYLIACLEFTCAQSPYSMRGLLVGVSYSVTLLTVFIGGGIQNAWTYLSHSNKHLLYYLVFQFLCAVVGLIVLCIVARWYKRRRREEEDDQRRIVEEIYDRMLHNQSHAK